MEVSVSKINYYVYSMLYIYVKHVNFTINLKLLYDTRWLKSLIKVYENSYLVFYGPVMIQFMIQNLYL